MIATSAGIGIWLTQGPCATQKTSSITPAKAQESRPRPPDFTLIMLWPIIAQPAMPPMKPVAVLARPWPMHSRLRSVLVSVSSSTRLCVIRLSNRPTTATAMA